MIKATPWGTTPRHLLHDHDASYGRDFRQRARRIGIDAVATPVASRRANAVIERFIGTLRLETPMPTLRSVQGSVRSRPVLGGLHYVYERAA